MSVRRIVLRGLGVAGLVVLAALLAVTVYVARTWNRTYNIPEPQVVVSTAPEVLARGEDPWYGPAHCVECHSASAEEYLTVVEGGNPAPKGGMPFLVPPLGVLYSSNLTPDRETGLGRYSNGQIARMMRTSVKPDGRASAQLLMPFHEISEEDLVAIISYLRAIDPVRNPVPDSEYTLIGKVVRSFAPVFKPHVGSNPPASTPSGGKALGEYLARSVANCVGCHTPRDPLTFAATGPEFSGGFEMEPVDLPGADKGLWFRSPNITPANGSALLKFPDRATFIARFKVGGRQLAGSPMAWEAFARMTESDLGTVYDYLHSLPAAPGATGEVTFRPE